MNHFQHSLVLETSPAAVYAALTTPDGLRGWWSQDADIATQVGGTSEFRFNCTHKRMAIERLERDRTVQWRCTGDQRADIDQQAHDGEWIGTRIVFRLTPEDTAHTRLEFEHVGLVPEFQCYTECSRGWQFFLTSLQKLVETGHGTPYPTYVSQAAVTN